MPNFKILFRFGAGAALVAVLWMVRMVYTGSHFYGFLLWNLFLAFIPYCVSQYMLVHFGHKENGLLHKCQWWLLFTLWLLFFPNAPYVITDLIHLSKRHGVPKWYDVAMLFCAGATGLWIGYMSLMQMEAVWRQKVKQISSHIFIVGVMLLSGFGIYLGRVMRFNSWDVVADPMELAKAVASRIIMPWQHTQTWGVTCLFAALLWVGYQQAKGMIKETNF